MKSSIAIAGVLAVMVPPVFADNTTQHNDNHNYKPLSRYVSIYTNVSHQQQHPLQTVVSVHLPPTISNLGQAISYALLETGYRLHDLNLTPAEARTMYRLPVPMVQRKFEYVTVLNIIKTLAGDAFIPLADPVHRKVAFKPVVAINRSKL